MYEIQQFIDSKNENTWFTIDCYDNLNEAKEQLDTLKADPYYSKFQMRIHTEK